MGKPTWSGQDFSKKPAKVASVKKIAPGIKDCGSPFHNGQITDSVTQVRRYADGSPGGVKADEPGFFASVRDFFTKERPTSGSVSDEVYASKSYQDDKAAGLKASEGEKVGFFERLRMGNIDDPNSEAYRRFGAGRGADERIKALPNDGSNDRVEANRLSQRSAPTPSPASATATAASAPAKTDAEIRSQFYNADGSPKDSKYKDTEFGDMDGAISRASTRAAQDRNTGIMTREDGKQITSETGQEVFTSVATPARASSGSSGASARPAGGSARAARPNTNTNTSPAPRSNPAPAARGNSRSNLDTDSIQTMANQLIDLNKRIADPATPAQAKAQFEAARARIQAAMRDRAAAGK